MLTIFSTTKPFTGHNATIQMNAIRSWVRLDTECEIILFGDAEGTEKVCSDLGLRYFPDVECNESGTPLISSMFGIAQKTARHERLCYINADIILMNDFLPAIRQIKKSEFLVVGRRWDLDVDTLLDFNNTGLESILRSKLAESGRLHGVSGMDYFVFSRNLYRDIPPFAVGRPGWDNWIIYHTRSMKIPVIDATGAITIIHQNHDYSHHPGGKEGVWNGPEKQKNIELMGGVGHSFSVEHASHVMKKKGIKPAISPRHIYFRMTALPVLHPGLSFLRKPIQILTRMIIFIRRLPGISGSE